MLENKIAYWAEVKGHRHKFLAKQIGVSEQTFSSWAKNKTQPDLIQSAVLARIFNITLDQLVGIKEEEK